MTTLTTLTTNGRTLSLDVYPDTPFFGSFVTRSA